jgi:chaperonin GroES
MLKPLGARVLVKQTEEEQVSPGGIVLPTAAQEKPTQGTVVAVGPDVQEVKTEDTVLFKKFTETEIQHLGETYLMFKEEDLLAIIGG